MDGQRFRHFAGENVVPGEAVGRAAAVVGVPGDDARLKAARDDVEVAVYVGRASGEGSGQAGDDGHGIAKCEVRRVAHGRPAIFESVDGVAVVA